MSEKDNTELTPAEENPWYVLATLHGENPDEARQKRNKSSWDNFFKHKLEGQPLDEEVTQLFKSRLPDQPLPNPEKEIDFSGTEFKEPLNLKRFVLPKYANFTNSKFIEGIFLTNAKFNSSANFAHAKFFKFADFAMVEVAMHANFYQSDFNANECSKEIDFEECSRFDKAVFKHFCGFVDTNFHTPISFKNCQFIGPCNLSRAKFEKNYPVLEGTVLHQKTTVSAKKENWPDPQNCKQNPEEAKATCEILREQMEAQGLHEQAHFFFRREMHFAGKMLSSWQRLPNQLFACLSAYGFSLKRPLRALGILWFFPALIYAFWLICLGCVDCNGSLQNCVTQQSACQSSALQSVLTGSGLSLSNILQFTGLQRTYFDYSYINCLPWGLKFLGGLQTLLAIPLLFLLLLGLRNRFRLK